ncbi:MAG: peptidylprolyl isomerase [Clostridia bacterium]|nr:peptidylprolyl isomerase [Clostridia bacterium]
MAKERTERAVKDIENDYRAERKKRLAKAAKKKNKKTRDSTDVIATVIKVIACLLVVGIIGFALYMFGVPQRLLPALKVGDRSYSVAEYGYYYTNVYNNYANNAYSMQEQYGFNLTGFDYTKSPADQSSGDKTFNEVFQDAIVTMLEEQNYYYNLAKDSGMTLTEEHQNAIKDEVSTIETYAANQPMSPDSYLSYIYGKGMNLKLYRKVLEEQYLAEQYKEDMESAAAKEITDDAIEAEYQKDTKLYDAVDIRLFGLTIGEDTETAEPESTTAAAEEPTTDEAASEDAETTSEESSSEEPETEEPSSEEVTDEEPSSEEPAESEDETTTEAAAETKSKQELLAEEMCARVTDEESFVKLAVEYAAEADKKTFEDPDNTLQVGVKYNTIKTNFNEELAEWLFASERKIGDKRTCKNDKYVFVIMMVKLPYREESALVSARHILISFDSVAEAIKAQDSEVDTANTEVKEETASDGTKVTNKDTEYSAEVVLKAYEQAKEVYEKYNSGEKTEEAFAALAEEYSADTGSVGENATNGGGLYTDIPKGQMVKPFEEWIYDSARKAGDTGVIMTKYGYHVMYFVGAHDEPEWKESVRSSLAKSMQEASEESAKTNYEGTAKDSMCIGWAKKAALKMVEEMIARNYSSAS